MFETSSEKSKSVDLRFELARDFHRELTRLMMVSGSGVRQVPRFLLFRFGGFGSPPYLTDAGDRYTEIMADTKIGAARHL
jgi:hypothetical protein